MNTTLDEPPSEFAPSIMEDDICVTRCSALPDGFDERPSHDLGMTLAGANAPTLENVDPLSGSRLLGDHD